MKGIVPLHDPITWCSLHNRRISGTSAIHESAREARARARSARHEIWCGITSAGTEGFKPKERRAGLVRVPLFWKSHCAICVSA